MIDKLKKYQNHPWVKQIQDTRSAGLVVLGIVALMVSWSSINAIQSNYELQKKIARLEQQNEVQELVNSNLRLRNEYLNTEQFLELAARRQFGKALPGETLLLVPKEVALKHTVEPPENESEDETPVANPHKPTYQKNFEAWINFFLNRQEAFEE